jgi:hypothetical protein
MDEATRDAIAAVFGWPWQPPGSRLQAASDETVGN